MCYVKTKQSRLNNRRGAQQEDTDRESVREARRLAAQLFSHQKKAYVPEIGEGEVVSMSDHCTVISVTVLRCTSPRHYDVIDSQGFIHVAEIAEDEHEYKLVALVKPVTKFKQGYDQKKSGASRKVVYQPSYTM